MKDNRPRVERPWNDGEASKPYTVSLWWDKPGETDTCMTSVDFATEKEARLAQACLEATFPCFRAKELDVPYILLDGPNVHEVTCRTEALKRSERERKADEEADRREYATQCGMEMGIHAYNDAMGYDSEPYDPSIHDTEDYGGYDREEY